jgi:hypothetical protein
MAQAYRPSYLGGRDWKDPNLRLGQTKKFIRALSEPMTGHGSLGMSSQLHGNHK